MINDFFLTEWIFRGMRWLYENVVNNSVFLTILISTVLLRLITLFSDIKQRKNTAKSAELQPKIKKLQEQYKNNPQKLQQEQQKLMKESGIGMLSGCLPLIITMVLLFCFIAAFRFWSYEQNVKTIDEMSENIAVAMRTNGYVANDADTVTCIEEYERRLAEIENIDEKDRDAAYNELYSKIEVSDTFLKSQFFWINNIWQPDNGLSPVVIPANTFFAGTQYRDTKKLIYLHDHPEIKEKLTALGLFYDERTDYSDVNPSGEIIPASEVTSSGIAYKELSDTQKKGLSERAKARYEALTAPLSKVYEGHNNGWFILPVLATLFQILYMLVSQKQVTKAQEGMQGAGANKIMLWAMPVMSFFFCLNSTAAFALYWTLSSITMLIVNIILSKVIKTGAPTTKKEA